MILLLAIARRFADNVRLGRDMTACSCPRQDQGSFEMGLCDAAQR
jgi:hypothetical protein